MSRQRLELALNLIRPAQWERFEQFASEFLVSDFPNLRTVASNSGDRGRDAEIFSPADDPSVLIQYAIRDDWEKKIVETAIRIRSEFTNASVLIYATNKQLGADADEIKKKLRRNYKLYLDVRDRNWFLERRDSSNQTRAATDSLIADIADPYLRTSEVITTKAVGLSSIEAQAALVYLELQWEDDTREKGLTKLCFEALVRAVLRDTDSEHRLPREEVRKRVRHILATHPAEQVNLYTDNALRRLEKNVLRHWRKTDEFCLSHQERLRISDRLAELEGADREFQSDLRSVLIETARQSKIRVQDSRLLDLISRMRRVLERLLLSRGEAFVSAIKSDYLQLATDTSLEDLTIQDLGTHPEKGRKETTICLIVTSLRRLLSNPPEAAQKYLRSLADAYTLMAFLRETPDVQSAITKIFSHGQFWLDTNIILPLFAEELLAPSAKRFQTLLAAAREFGLELRITSGVLEELDRHINRCLTFARGIQAWEGPVPFLVAIYTETGRPLSSFASWVELFRGQARPETDIADYIERFFGINLSVA